MKLPQPFTIYDLRFTIGKNRRGGTGVAPVVSGVAPEILAQRESLLNSTDCRRGMLAPEIRRDAGFDRRDACSTAASNRKSSIVNRKWEQGIALVITLIMLSV